MTIRIRFALSTIATMALAGCAAALIACSGASPSGSDDTNSSDLHICVGSVCVDADIPNLPNVPGLDAGSLIIPIIPGIPFDGGLPSFDAGLPPGVPSFDAGLPPGVPSFDAGGFGGFGGPGACATDPKYANEYATAAASGAVNDCSKGCAATECCFGGIACVAK